jgi:outer membrane protein assembly factor BamA
MTRAISAAVFSFLTFVAGAAFAEAPAAPVAPVDPERHELAGFPIIGGNSDIGVQFGGAATLTRFHDGLKPYLWNLDLLLSASIKSDQNGTRLIQQSHVLRFDAPHLLGGRLRIDTRGSFQRTINAEYFGVGNASTADPAPGQTSVGRRFQYVQQEARVRVIARVHTGTPFDLALGGSLRYEAPDLYVGSKLAEDAAARGPDGSPIARGTEAAALATGAVGFIVDTRDTEFITTRGLFYQVGVGVTGGSAEGVAYGNTSAVLSHYAPIGGPFIFASRLVLSFELGNVPFYDLAQGGTFEPQYLLGSESGVRGVPIGRYAGLVKMVSNVEIRAPFPRFQLFGQRFRLGTTTFADAGRAWADYGVHPALDGTKLGLKFGVGAGVFLQWGDAAIFRVEAAYSPDAVSENPGFPVGIYVADGLMF